MFRQLCSPGWQFISGSQESYVSNAFGAMRRDDFMRMVWTGGRQLCFIGVEDDEHTLATAEDDAASVHIANNFEAHDLGVELSDGR